MPRKIRRSSETGKFVSKEHTHEFPHSTTTETLTNPHFSLLADHVRQMLAEVDLPGKWFVTLRNDLARIDEAK